MKHWRGLVAVALFWSWVVSPFVLRHYGYWDIGLVVLLAPAVLGFGGLVSVMMFSMMED